MATKYNPALLKQAYEIEKLVEVGALSKGAKEHFARAKRVSRTSLSKHLKAWKEARGL